MYPTLNLTHNLTSPMHKKLQITGIELMTCTLNGRGHTTKPVDVRFLLIVQYHLLFIA